MKGSQCILREVTTGPLSQEILALIEQAKEAQDKLSAGEATPTDIDILNKFSEWAVPHQIWVLAKSYDALRETRAGPSLRD